MRKIALFRYFVLASMLAFMLSLSLVFSHATGGDKLYKYQFIKGSDPSIKVLNEDLNLNRAELATIVSQLYRAVENAKFEGAIPETSKMAKENLLALVEKAEKLSLDKEYIDFTRIPSWAKPHVKFVTSLGLMSGLPGKRFAPNEKITGQQLAALMLRSMGYKDVAWANIPQKIKELGLSLNMGVIRRGEAFDFIWAVLSKPLSSDKTCLGIKLGVLTEARISEESELDSKSIEITKDSIEFEPHRTDVIETIKDKKYLLAFSEFETLRLTGNINSALKNYVYHYNDNVRSFMKEELKRVTGTARVEAQYSTAYLGHNATITHDVVYTNPKLISIAQKFTIFMGGVASKSYKTYNVDVQKGQLIPLKERIINKNKLAELITLKMSEKAGRKSFDTSDQLTQSQINSIIEIIDKEGNHRFSIDSKGIRYYFSKYELSFFALDSGSVLIPYEALDGLFNYEGLI